MGLFSRRKRTTAQEAEALDPRDERENDDADDATEQTDDAVTAESADKAGLGKSADRAGPGKSADDAGPAEQADDAEDDAQQAGEEEAPTPRGEHLENGPFDEADAPEEDRIDLGGLLVPTVDGMELRMEIDQRSGAVTGANLVLGGSSLQVQAFAAPKSRGLWEDVRGSLRDSVVSQGGTAETRAGAFGTELITRLPVKRADGRTGYRPARFIGIDGRRWFLRAILTGKALGDPEQSRRFETLVSRLVVVRGSGAMAPQELIPLHLPGERPGLDQIRSGPLDPLARGPEITQIG